MNILITGGNGYIGTSLASHLSKNHTVTTVGRKDFDLSNSSDTTHWFGTRYFDVVIHAAISGGSRLQVDGSDVLDNNLKMYYNLLNNRSSYGKLINIGSGAELMSKESMYGLSKHIIRTSLLDKPNFYNLRVFAVFDENELSSRFIKHNIMNYIHAHSMIIHQNKYMDFFYMKDFCSVVDYYISSAMPPKEYNCSYENTVSLAEIAEYINTLGKHRVDIAAVAPGTGPHYSAEYPREPLPIDVIGLFTGITNVYNTLLCKK